jgi:integrase
MRRTITEALVKKALPGFIRDDRVIGFGLRTTKGGSKSFIAEARVAGRVRRFAIAPVDRLTVAEARDEARKILADMSKGVDPQLARRAKRERAKTLGEMLDDYLDAKAVKASTATKYRGVLRRTLSDWLKKPIAEITRDMVRVRYEQLAKRSVSEANNAMRVLRAVSRRAEIVLPNRADGSPAMRGVATTALRGAWRALERRTRVLEPQEIGAWLKGVDSLRSERSRRALKTLLLTGLRVQEALGLSWQHVEEDKQRLVIADSKTGSFVKIIGPRLSAMLAEWREDAKSGLVFDGVNDLRSALMSVEREGGKATTPHDLRRTFASFAERAGAPFTTLKVLLNHSTRADVTMGYVWPSEEDLRHWAAVVETALHAAAAEGGEVVRLPARGGAAMSPDEFQSEISRLASIIGEPAPSIRSGKDAVEFFNHFDRALLAKLKAIHVRELIRAERLLRAVLSPTEYGDWRKARYKPNEELTRKFLNRVRRVENAKGLAKSHSNAGMRNEIVRQLAVTPLGPSQANTIAKRVGCTPHEVRRVRRTEERRAAQKNGSIGLV